MELATHMRNFSLIKGVNLKMRNPSISDAIQAERRSRYFIKPFMSPRVLVSLISFFLS